jgi:hypothetical protein
MTTATRILAAVIAAMIVAIFVVLLTAAPAPHQVVGASIPVPTAQPAPIPPPAPQRAPEVTPIEYIMTAHTLKGAMKVARPRMSDESDGKDSDGAVLLALWAAGNMHWSDVSVATDETSFALIRKDPDAERGKRLCTSGTVLEIHVEKFSAAAKYFN